MIASKAIKVYASVGQPDGEYVTTVCSADDAIKVRAKLFKRTGIRRVIFKTVKEKELASYTNNEVHQL